MVRPDAKRLVSRVSSGRPREASATLVGCESLSLDLFHERRRLDAKDLRDLDEFKDVELSFTGFEFPDE